MAAHSNIVAWIIPWIEESCGLQSTGTQLRMHTCIINEKVKINEKHIVIVQSSLFGNNTIRFKLNKKTEKCIWKFNNVHGSWAEGEIINHNGC